MRGGAGKLVGCRDLNEAECEKNQRCAWNVFNIEDFNLKTNPGAAQKLWDLRESIVKGYTKGELKMAFGTEDPTLLDVYIRAQKEHDDGLRGLCGEKMLRGENLSDILDKKFKEKYPDLHGKQEKKKKQKNADETAELAVKQLLKEAEKSERPSEEIQRIIEGYGVINKQLGQILDKHAKLFESLVTPEDPKEIDNLIKEVAAELAKDKD